MGYSKIDQVSRLKTKLAKARLPSLPEQKKSLQRVVNKYVRERDREKPCISCGKLLVVGKYDAGHYIAQGSSGALRFDLQNIHGQCDSCNRFKHGNSIEYRIELVKRIGLPSVERLENTRRDIKKWTSEELAEIRQLVKTAPSR